MKMFDRVPPSVVIGALLGMTGLMAACGGGGGSAAHPVAVTPLATATSAPQMQSVTLVYPANFHHARSAKAAKTSAGSGSRMSAATRTPSTLRSMAALSASYSGRSIAAGTVASKRSPAYINPTSSDILYVYNYICTGEEDCTNQLMTPNGIPLNTLTANADGSVTLVLPVLSSAYDIEVREYDSRGMDGGQILADGSISPNVSAGGSIGATPTPPPLVMEMNAEYLALTTDPANGTDAVAFNSDDGGSFCVFPGKSLYAFGADPSLSFVLPGVSAGAVGDAVYAPYPGIPLASLFSQSSATYDSSRLVGSALGLTPHYTNPNSSIISAQFELQNPYQENTNYFGVEISGSTASPNPCYVTASFASNDSSSTGEGGASTTVASQSSDTLVVSGGTPFSAPQTSPYVAPYAVTDADGFCTLSPAAYTALGGANWTVTAKGTGTPCNLVITDANGTTQSATVNVTGISGPQHLITVSSLRNACMSGSGYESTANQCYLEYGSSSAAQGTDSFVLTESNPPDGSGNFSIVPSGNCSAIAPTFSALYGPGTLSGFDVTYGTGSFYGSCVISITDNYLNTATVTIYVDQTNLTVQGKSRRK